MDITDLIIYGVFTLAALALAYYYFFAGAPKPAPMSTFKPTAVTFKPTPSPMGHKGKGPAKEKKKGVAPVKILYGSQTGTAEDFAATLTEEAESHNFSAECIDLEEFEVDSLAEEKFIIFVMSTYGEGEPTDNAKAFYDWLLDESRTEDLSGLKYTIFGLGNRTYEKFNAVSRAVDKRLQDLGAVCIFPRGEGDDDGSQQEDFDNWKNKMWDPVCRTFGIDPEVLDNSVKKPLYALKKHKEGSVTLSTSVVWVKKAPTKEVSQSNPRSCRVLVNRELHGAGSDRSCRHLEIDLGGADLKYQPGDHLGIFAVNDSSLVERMARRLNLSGELDEIISLRPADQPKARPVLGPCSIREALAQFVELTGQPTKKLLKVLAEQYTSDPVEKERLSLLASSSEKGWEEYRVYIQGAQRILVEVLEDFPSCNPPLEHLLELLPAMQPRYYSISSAIEAHPQQVHVTAVVVEYQTPTQRVHKGVCTSFLAALNPGDSVFCFVRTSTFHLPPLAKRGPVLMVGPGTGLAPFRGFLQFLEATGATQQNGHPPVWLFFGCRNSQVDFIYRQELEEWVEKGVISRLVLAFSREGPEKVYVQHRLKQYERELWPMMSQNNCTVYVCGDAKNMAKDVHKALRQISIDIGGKSNQEAESFITNLQTSNRYLQDVWA